MPLMGSNCWLRDAPVSRILSLLPLGIGTPEMWSVSWGGSPAFSLLTGRLEISSVMVQLCTLVRLVIKIYRKG